MASKPKHTVVKNGDEIKIPDFDSIEPSTITMMVYCNIKFDIEKFYRAVKIQKVEATKTRRHGNINKKSIRGVPYGSIISAQYQDEIKGLDLRKKKPNKKKAKTKKSGKEIDWFRNQIMLTLALDDDLLLNIMIFNGCFKIAGCKRIEDAYEATMILWEEYIRHDKTLWSYVVKPDEDDKIFFLTEMVMRNIDFHLGFCISREQLNYLMNKPEYKDIVHLSQYESTEHTNVNVRMKAPKPDSFRYDVLVYKNMKDDKPYFTETSSNNFGKAKVKKKYTTFIVFSTSEIILSGRYIENMKNVYNFFVNTVLSHRDILEEQVGKHSKPFSFIEEDN